MSEGFAKKWVTMRDEQPLTNCLKDVVKSQDPPKPCVALVAKRIELLIQKLFQTEDRFDQRHKAILSRIVDAYSKHETTCACVFANELAEVQKVSFLIINSKLALEQTAFRLQTVSEKDDDVISTLGMALGVIQTVKSRFVSVFPEAEKEFGEISNMLNGIMIEVGQSSGMSLNLDAVNINIGKILTETATVAQQRIKEKFPDSTAKLPGTI